MRSVACGANHSGAVTGTGQAGGAGVYMWGNGANSRLGAGNVDASTEQQVTHRYLVITPIRAASGAPHRPPRSARWHIGLQPLPLTLPLTPNPNPNPNPTPSQVVYSVGDEPEAFYVVAHGEVLRDYPPPPTP